MGIQGLTSLIEVNPHLLEDMQLRDINLVVDGNSFCYQIYSASRIDSRFGGDYPKYQEFIHGFLDRLIACNIRATFIFDGLLDIEKLKWQTAIQRQKTRLHAAKSLVALNSRESILPILCPHVLFEILMRRGIEIVQSAGDADAIAVGLANDRHAPLLSQDSDFFIFDLKFGYIAFETLEWNENSKQSFIPAKLYKLDNLLEHYPRLDRRLLPLFAFLCGNDFSSGYNLGKFFHHIHKPNVTVAGHGEVSSKRRKGNAVRPMRRHCNMLAVLEWLQGKTDEEKIIDEALKWIEEKRREKVRVALKRSTAAYRRCELVEMESDGIPGRFDVVSTVKRNISHLVLPEWLISGYIKGEIPAIILQVMQDRRLFLPATIEDFTRPSVYDCSRPIRLAVYGILLKNFPANKQSVMEYSRDGGHFVRRLLTLENGSDSSLPSLKDIQNLSSDERQKLFYNCLDLSPSDLEVISKFPKCLTVFVSSFVCWCHSEDTRVKKWQACALLLCCFWLCNRKDSVDSEKIFSHGEQLGDISQEFDFTPNLSAKRGGVLCLSNLHAFSQWQTCFQACIWLNSILMQPFGWTVPMQYLFHGRVLYNLALYLENAKSEEIAFRHLFQNANELAKNFGELWTLLKNSVPASDPVEKTGAKKTNRRKQKAIAATLTIVESPVNSDKESSQSEHDEIWALENRFRTLVSLKP